VDPKALQLGVSKLKNLANNALLVECKSKTDHDILEKKLGKLSTVTVGRPKRELPTLILMFVSKEAEDAEIKDTILQQNSASNRRPCTKHKIHKIHSKTQDMSLLKLAQTCGGN
jgi:hypothetical protein